MTLLRGSAWRVVPRRRGSDQLNAAATTPGEMPLTRIGASSTAMLLAMPNMAPLTMLTMVDPEWAWRWPVRRTRRFDARPTLARQRLPTLITAGRFDRIAAPRIALEVSRLVPDHRARATIFERSGHAPSIEEANACFIRLRPTVRLAYTGEKTNAEMACVSTPCRSIRNAVKIAAAA